MPSLERDDHGYPGTFGGADGTGTGAPLTCGAGAAVLYGVPGDRYAGIARTMYAATRITPAITIATIHLAQPAPGLERRV